MSKCDCYHTRTKIVYGHTGFGPYCRETTVGECWGTKERDECSCGGYTNKCDFYPEKRKPKTHSDYIIREAEESMRILKDEMAGLGDKDIHNLEIILYSIKPYSYWWRRGCVSSLRKAIKALKKEKEKTDET